MMTPEEKKLLEEIHEVVLENNAILKKLRSISRLSTIWKIVYWTIIIGLTIWSYSLVQPYINQLFDVYAGFSGDANSVKNAIGTVGDVSDMLNGL